VARHDDAAAKQLVVVIQRRQRGADFGAKEARQQGRTARVEFRADQLPVEGWAAGRVFIGERIGWANRRRWPDPDLSLRRSVPAYRRSSPSLTSQRGAQA